ncbi:MAG: ribosome-associated heat shock protein Hsp15 [Alcanivoracaceae bacterium]|nr:ribosome-associated heat shock protein Hsp15 [Alcanivoracaceae bacterium]
MNEVRIDKWLWAARFYKTRSLAQQMVEGGKVHVDGQRVKASKPVRVGQVIVLRQGEVQREVEVLALAEKRGSAPQAALLYQETQDSIARREQVSAERRAAIISAPHPDHRPDKKARRDLRRFRDRQARDT